MVDHWQSKSHLVLPALALLTCWSALSAASGPSPDSLRRYLSLYEQQRRLERLKAARYLAENGPPYPRDPQEDPTTRSSSPRGWRGQGQPEVFADEPYPPPQTLQLGGEAGPGRINIHVIAPQASQTDANSASPEDIVQKQLNDFGLGAQEKKSQQDPQDSPWSTGAQRTSTVQVSGEPFAQRHSAADVETKNKNPLGDVYFVVIAAGCSAAAIFGVVAAGYCFYRFQKNSKAAAEVDYPAYGVTGPNKDQTSPNGDRRLAQSAQMYHYQHQKQQMIAVEKATTARNTSASDIDSEEENEEGDYTVYECPGLAPTGEMEVKNPLFHDDSTPMSPPVVAKEIKKP